MSKRTTISFFLLLRKADKLLSTADISILLPNSPSDNENVVRTLNLIPPAVYLYLLGLAFLVNLPAPKRLNFYYH